MKKVGKGVGDVHRLRWLTLSFCKIIKTYFKVKNFSKKYR